MNQRTNEPTSRARLIAIDQPKVSDIRCGVLLAYRSWSLACVLQLREWRRAFAVLGPSCTLYLLDIDSLGEADLRALGELPEDGKAYWVVDGRIAWRARRATCVDIVQRCRALFHAHSLNQNAPASLATGCTQPHDEWSDFEHSLRECKDTSIWESATFARHLRSAERPPTLPCVRSN